MIMEKNMQKIDGKSNECAEDKNMYPLVFVESGRMFTTSLIVAETFGKHHKNVLQGIENLECSKEFHQRNFKPMVYTAEIGSGAKREFPAYTLTRDGFIFLSMEFTETKTNVWKEKFLEAFNTMAAHLPGRQPDDYRNVDFSPGLDTLFKCLPHKVRTRTQRNRGWHGAMSAPTHGYRIVLFYGPASGDS